MVRRAGVVRRANIVHRVPAMHLSCVRRLGIGNASVLALVVRALWCLSCGCVSRGIGHASVVVSTAVASVVCVSSWSR